MDTKVTRNLRSIKDLHRNTLMHPEENLNLEEAVMLLGIIGSSISSMLNILPIDAPRLDGPDAP